MMNEFKNEVEGQEVEGQENVVEPTGDVVEPTGELENELNTNNNSDESNDSTDENNIKNEDENDANNEDENKEPSEPKIERTTAIEKVHKSVTIKWILNNKEKLRFDLAIQRGLAWSTEQKSLFVHSLIYGYPFPPAYAQDNGDGLLWLLDGKQRLTTIIDFCSNKFKLHKQTPSVFGYEIKGKTFKELPKQFQEDIHDVYFTIYQMRGLTQDERDTMFVRLNKGTPVSKIAQTRAEYSDLITQLEQIAGLEFFVNHVFMGKTPKNFADQEVVLQTAILLEQGHELKGIGSVQIAEYVKQLKAKDELISENVLNKFIEADEYLSIVCNELNGAEIKTIFKKVNVPMIVATALKAYESDVDTSTFGDFLVDFLINNYTKETTYGRACQSGSAKRENVLIRLDEMDKHFVDFVNQRIDAENNVESNLNNEDMDKQVG